MKIGKSKIFLLFLISFLVGVFAGRFFNFYFMAITAMIFIAVITVFWSHRRPLLLGFLGLTLLLGAVRYQTSLLPDRENFIGKLYGQKAELVGVISREPDVRSSKTNLTVTPQNFEGQILLTVGRYPEYRYGDELKISGKIEEPFATEDFSYKNYLSRFDTYAVMSHPRVEKLAEGKGHKIVAVLLGVKRSFQEVLSKILPEPHNALALGLLLGLKRSLPDSLKEALVAGGVSHIVVISGYNISIITRNLLKTRTIWGRKVAFFLSCSAVLAFVILTGAEASVIRAAIMGLLLVVALNVGRIYQATNALVLAGATMVAINPKILSFDVGFQLSFLATFGLIYLSPVLEKWFAKVPDILGLRTNLASTLAAQIFTAPFLIYYFDRISLLAPLVNLLVLWVIPYIMLLSFFVGLAGMVYLPLALLVSGIPWLFLEYLIRTVEFFSKLPWASVSTLINFPNMVLYYGILIAALAWYRYRVKFVYYLEYVEAKI